MIFQKDDKPPLQFSNMPSNPTVLHNDQRPTSSVREGISRSAVKNKPKIAKPLNISKRSVSLPSDLQKPSVKTRKLFWFIPKENRGYRRSRQNNHCPNGESSYETSMPKTEQQIETRRNTQDQGPPFCVDIPEKAAREWITSSSTHSLSDNSTSDQSDDFCFDDDQDDNLLGLEFLNSQRDEHRW